MLVVRSEKICVDKKYSFRICFLIFCCLISDVIGSTASSQVPYVGIHREFIESTISIKHDNATGSAFSCNHKNKTYVISAKHLFPNIIYDKPFQLEVFHAGKWGQQILIPIELKKISMDYDVAIFSLPTQIPAPECNLGSIGPTYGQEVFFLGFPLNMKASIPPPSQFPCPLVKKANVSGFKTEEGYMQIILDGHNNKGFSGGPIVFFNYDKNYFQFAGVVSSFQPEPIHKVVLKNNVVVPELELSKENFENSGIFYGHDLFPIKNYLDSL